MLRRRTAVFDRLERAGTPALRLRCIYRRGFFWRSLMEQARWFGQGLARIFTRISPGPGTGRGAVVSAKSAGTGTPVGRRARVIWRVVVIQRSLARERAGPRYSYR